MARHARSLESKQHSKRQEVIAQMQRAVSAFRERQLQGLKPKIRQVAREFDVSHVTLGRHLKPGYVTMDEFNASKTKLSPAFEHVLVEWIIELADRNLGLTSAMIYEYAVELLRSVDPDAKLGTTWTRRFLLRHQDVLESHWSRPLDKVRALSATPAVMDRFFQQYKSIVGESGEKIPPHRQFAYDESGVLRGMGYRSRVVSSRNNKAAKVNRGGSRELITFVPIISGTGQLIDSLVVFPGKLLRRNWVESNPGKFAATVSEKGYMNNLLGLEFIKFFHNSTAHLQSEGPRLLHVDCHSSHINLPLLKFAIDHNIIILGYPPHTTNLTQGLDVVIFSSFKNSYAKLANAHLRSTGQDVEKRDFLRILYEAVQESFTKENILAAWRKTGLRPVDRGAISDQDLAPSRAWSIVHALPIPPPSPIRAVVNAMHRQNSLCDDASLRSTPPLPEMAIASHASLPSFIFSSLECPATSAMPDDSTLTESPSCALSAILSETGIMPEISSNHNENITSLSNAFNELDLGPPDDNSGTTLSADESHAINMAGDILRSLASTSLASILELDTVNSSCSLPPIESGPFPTQLVELLKRHEGMPSETLWNAVKMELIHLVPRAERQLALNTLQHLYCQQFQRKLATHENSREKTGLQKVKGFKYGLIFTDANIVAALELEDEEKAAEQARAEQKQLDKELLDDAEKWLEAAKEAQKEEHERLVARWQATPVLERPTKRQPRLPPLAQILDRYKEVLSKKKRRSAKRAPAQRPADDDSYVD